MFEGSIWMIIALKAIELMGMTGCKGNYVCAWVWVDLYILYYVYYYKQVYVYYGCIQEIYHHYFKTKTNISATFLQIYMIENRILGNIN